MLVTPPPAGSLDEMELGFSFAAAFMFTWVAIQRDRFIKFWYFWRKPPYKRSVKIGFQIVFVLWALGAIWHFVDDLLAFHPGLDWKQAATDALAWSAAVVLMINAVEWMGRRRDAKGQGNQELKAKS